MPANPRIAILLSTYNGAGYLAEQLDSILGQSYDNLVIVVRDDGSSDSCPALLEQYAAEKPQKFHLVTEISANLGASESFSRLIEYVLEHKSALGLGQAYMMFADQDDIWHPDKVARQLEAMRQQETAAAGKDALPVLVHSDLKVVSEQKQLIAPSLVRYQGLEIERNRFPNLVISNLVTGCTALINEELARKAVPVSKRAIMHDWWLALVASAFGRVVFLDTPLVDYRQHGSNTIGAKEFIKPPVTDAGFWRKLFAVSPNEHLLEVARQASDFRLRFGSQLSLRENLGLQVARLMQTRVGFLQRFFYRLARKF